MKGAKATTRPTSVRFPRALKLLVDEAADKAGQSINEYVVSAVEMRIRGACKSCGRDLHNQMPLAVGGREDR